MSKSSATWYCAVRERVEGEEYLDVLSVGSTAQMAECTAARLDAKVNFLTPRSLAPGLPPVTRIVSLIAVEEETIKEVHNATNQ